MTGEDLLSGFYRAGEAASNDLPFSDEPFPNRDGRCPRTLGCTWPPPLRSIRRWMRFSRVPLRTVAHPGRSSSVSGAVAEPPEAESWREHAPPLAHSAVTRPSSSPTGGDELAQRSSATPARSSTTWSRARQITAIPGGHRWCADTLRSGTDSRGALLILSALRRVWRRYQRAPGIRAKKALPTLCDVLVPHRAFPDLEYEARMFEPAGDGHRASRHAVSPWGTTLGRREYGAQHRFGFPGPT